MENEPTTTELEEIEHYRDLLGAKIEKTSASPLIGPPTAYGKELLEDTKAFLSLLPHQAFVENSMREFHSVLAAQILENSKIGTHHGHNVYEADPHSAGLEGLRPKRRRSS